MTDAELIEKIKENDRLAFKELIDKYETQIASVTLNMLGDCPEAEDIGQEVFIRFYKNINNFRGEAAINTYLTRIAINLSLNELKRRKRKRIFFTAVVDVHDSPIMGQDGDDEYQDKEIRELINKSVQQLSSKYRAVVLLRLIEGFSTEETAQILAIPMGTVASRLARAQLKLKNMLSKYMQERAA